MYLHLRGIFWNICIAQKLHSGQFGIWVCEPDPPVIHLVSQNRLKRSVIWSRAMILLQGGKSCCHMPPARSQSFSFTYPPLPPPPKKPLFTHKAWVVWDFYSLWADSHFWLNGTGVEVWGVGEGGGWWVWVDPNSNTSASYWRSTGSHFHTEPPQRPPTGLVLEDV